MVKPVLVESCIYVPKFSALGGVQLIQRNKYLWHCFVPVHYSYCSQNDICFGTTDSEAEEEGVACNKHSVFSDPKPRSKSEVQDSLRIIVTRRDI